VAQLEEELLSLEAKTQGAIREIQSLLAAARRLRAEIRVGKVAEIERILQQLQRRADELVVTARDLAGSWTFDASDYLANGGYLKELTKAAKAANLDLFERDGRIYCFPLLLRIEAKDSAIRVGRKLERRIRPSELVRILGTAQKRPQRFTESQFLDFLYKVYRRLAGPDWWRSNRGPGPAIPLADLYETATLLPGSDYPMEEFARDLLLLDRRPDLRTKDGCRFELPKATLGKGKARRLVAYDENGRERLYIGIRFLREN